jgi:hypothetical protein
MVVGRWMWYEWFSKNSPKWLWEDGCTTGLRSVYTNNDFSVVLHHNGRMVALFLM